MQIDTEQKRLTLSFAASVAVHLLVVLLVAFVHVDKPLPKKEKPQVMDVVMLNPKTPAKKTPPKDAKTVSNLNAEGSSRKAKDETTRAARAPSMSQQQQPQQKPQQPRPQMPKTPPPAEPDQRVRLLARRGGPEVDNNPKTTKKPAKKHEKKPPLPQIPLSNLMPSTMALSQLSQDFQREKIMKERLSKEADIPINTRQAKYAPYAHELVQALEEQWRPGQADYGKYADEQRRALLRITIEHDGSLGNVEILRPSPIAQINDSAVAAIHAAAPFRPLPSSWGLDRAKFYLTFEVVDNRFVFRTM